MGLMVRKRSTGVVEPGYRFSSGRTRSIRVFVCLVVAAAFATAFLSHDPSSESVVVDSPLGQDGQALETLLLVGSLPDGVSGEAYSESVLVADAEGAVVTIDDSSRVPDGVSLTSSGLLTGTPNGGGFYRLNLTAELNGAEQTEQLNWNVAGPGFNGDREETVYRRGTVLF